MLYQAFHGAARAQVLIALDKGEQFPFCFCQAAIQHGLLAELDMFLDIILVITHPLQHREIRVCTHHQLLKPFDDPGFGVFPGNVHFIPGHENLSLTDRILHSSFYPLEALCILESLVVQDQQDRFLLGGGAIYTNILFGFLIQR